jgi:hypothetical protein
MFVHSAIPSRLLSFAIWSCGQSHRIGLWYTGTTVMEDTVNEKTLIITSLRKPYDRNLKLCAYVPPGLAAAHKLHSVA